MKTIMINFCCGWLLLGGIAHSETPSHNPNLTQINPDYLISVQEAQHWHVAKDVLGPTFAGNDSWKVFMQVVETKLRDYGAVDLLKNKFTYNRWVTSEYPDKSKWSLTSNGKAIKVAAYNPNSGSTSGEGITRELVLFDINNPVADVKEKIAVVPLWTETDATPPEQRIYTWPGDYMYLSNPETFADPKIPRKQSYAVQMRTEMRQVREAMDLLLERGAAGALWATQVSYDRVAGLYTFGVPDLHQMPALYLDRHASAQVIADAKAGKQATLRLVADVVPTETYQLIAYLPGKDYGTERDEKIYMVTHTDGPSISQDNGAYGLLAVAKYFSHIPQNQRPRTIMFYFDCRHYMPGAERVHTTNWMADNPNAWDKVVASVGMEHLGQLEYEEIGDSYRQTGLEEHSRLHVANNDVLVEMAIKSVKDNGVRRVSVEQVDRPGIHGNYQGRWLGLGAGPRRRGLPAFATMGDMAPYWSTNARIDAFSAEHFVKQVATMSQLVGELMVADLSKIKPVPPQERQ